MKQSKKYTNFISIDHSDSTPLSSYKPPLYVEVKFEHEVNFGSIKLSKEYCAELIKRGLLVEEKEVNELEEAIFNRKPIKANI